jgi:hypothetical protein
VRKAIAEKRISRAVEAKRCIDPEVADIQWAKNTRARADSRSAPAAPAVGTTQSTAQPPAADPAGYSDHRARREKAEADKAELEANRMAGQLMLVEPGERAVFEAFRILRDATFSACRSSAPMVLGMTDVREIQHLLEDGLRHAFDDFEARIRAKLAEVTKA